VSERSEQKNKAAQARLASKSTSPAAFIVKLTISHNFTRFARRILLWYLALRARAAYEDFQILYRVFSITLGQAVLGLALVWIKIAIKGDFSASKKKLRRVDYLVKGVMVVYGVVGCYMCLTGKSRQIAGLGLFFLIFGSIGIKVGERR